jgi:16S rRNA (cytosine1402-N4)-methyltransferase
MNTLNNNDDNTHKRRVRYSGKYPRSFSQKYKEHAPEKYGDDIDKVVSRGQTPAGTHIPICPNEILSILKISPGMKVLDCTLGYGGHSKLMLDKLEDKGLLVGLDVDPIEMPKTETRLRKAGFSEQIFITRRVNFASINSLVFEFGKFDAILADLGVSSMQIDNPERGFTFKQLGPLDLRLNPNKGVPASQMISTMSEEEISLALLENSDEPFHIRLASVIYKSRKAIHTTRDLYTIIKNALQSKKRTDAEIKKSVQRSFQAFRIAVNEEFTVLDRLLTVLPSVLAPEGRVAILTFHSGEDRRIKKSFQNLYREGIYNEISKDVIRPSFEEQQNNPRSTSAKLRFAIRGTKQ